MLGAENSNSLKRAVLAANAILPEAKSTSLIERIQQKFSISKEDMQSHNVPAMKEEFTDAHLDAELARMKKQNRDKQRKLMNNGSNIAATGAGAACSRVHNKQRSIEVKYAELILNRNSSQYVSKSS